MIKATAPGKIILFGEHAVVYGRPAIAVPVSQVRATATVVPGEGGVRLVAPDLGLQLLLEEAPEEEALAAAVRQVQRAAGLTNLPDLTITVYSDIPIASGLGSGAAITAAVVRALAKYLRRFDLSSDDRVSALTYEVEKFYHGTPSGIDNSVVAFEQPIYFVRRQPQNLVETFSVTTPLRLLIGDTGLRSSTKAAVMDVRRQWEASPTTFETLFDGCGRITDMARAAIAAGNVTAIGRLMDENHALLQAMTVSSAELNRLVAAARHSGALGAKLSGAGRGGNMIALVTAETETIVRDALMAAGARSVLATVIQ